MTGSNRWVSSVLGTSGQGRHTKSAQGEVLARHGPENDDECPRLSKVPYFQSQTPDTPLEPILCTEPLDLVHIDYMSMEVMVGVKEKPVVKNVLVIKDHFTRYTQACHQLSHRVHYAHVLYNKRVQVEGMPHYDEHQVLFVLHDPSTFSIGIPVILGTPTINQVVQTIKETEMHNAPTEWQMARVAYEWAQGFQFHWASLGERLKFPTNTAEDPLDLDEKVLLTDKCAIPGAIFSCRGRGDRDAIVMTGVTRTLYMPRMKNNM